MWWMLWTVLVADAAAQSCQTCNCPHVATGTTTVHQLIQKSPLYLYSASTVTQQYGLDTVCSIYRTSNAHNSAFLEVTVTYTDGSNDTTGFLARDGDPGTQFVVGQKLDYDMFSVGAYSFLDQVLGEFCGGSTYAFYRCPYLGVTSETCEAGSGDEAEVYIYSTKTNETVTCLNRAKAAARRQIKGVTFYDLPRSASDPCPEGPSLPPGDKATQGPPKRTPIIQIHLGSFHLDLL